MNLKQIREQKKEVRILDSTHSLNDETRKMIGGIFEVRSEDYGDKTILVLNKDRSDYWIFNTSDTQPLTPFSFEGVRIGIGDDVKLCGDWHEVYGYRWCDGIWYLSTARNNDYEDCYTLKEDSMTAHRPLYIEKIKKEEIKKAIKLLKDKGLLKEGMILEK